LVKNFFGSGFAPPFIIAFFVFSNAASLAIFF
jgi:hypothetical protein